MFSASASTEPNATAAASFARVIVRNGIGNGPRIATSRGSSAKASQTISAASALTAVEAEMKRNRSDKALSAVGPGSWMNAARYSVETKNVAKTPSDTTKP